MGLPTLKLTTQMHLNSRIVNGQLLSVKEMDPRPRITIQQTT
jgi:hypothetical protein